MISGSNEQLHRQLKYTLLNPDCQSWWISKIQSGREDTLEERYAIKFCFKLEKSTTETSRILPTAFRPSCMNRASVFEWHKRFKEGWESVGDDERCGKSWLAKRLGLWLVCWGFRGVQEEIRSEEGSTLQIGSVAFTPGQCTSPQLHHYHRLSDQDGHQDSSSPSLQSTFLPVTFSYSLSSGTVVMGQLRRWKCLWRRSLTCSHKRTSMEPSRSCWEGTTSALQPKENTSKGTRVSCVYY